MICFASAWVKLETFNTLFFDLLHGREKVNPDAVIALVGFSMKFGAVFNGFCLSLFLGHSAMAETANWTIGAYDQIGSIDQSLLTSYSVNWAAISKSYDLTPSSFLVLPASDVAPQESFFSFALRRIETPGFGRYSAATFFDQSSDVWLDFTGLLALNIYGGLSASDISGNKFHFEDEGWFGKDTYALGMDKLGHAYGGYLYADYFAQRIAHSRGDAEGAGITGAILGFGVQSVVEVLDGFSSEYGFSNQDLIADGVGVGFAMLRNTIPGLSEKLDFRMEYNPWSAGLGKLGPFNDYQNQKYLLALKFSGFEQFQDTPLRFVELHAGYFARGFGEKGAPPIGELRREPYVAIGVNLAELFKVEPVRDTVPAQFARRAFEYIELPGTYAATVNQ